MLYAWHSFNSAVMMVKDSLENSSETVNILCESALDFWPSKSLFRVGLVLE